jgi:DNA-binding transcriptional LysR family regulator
MHINQLELTQLRLVEAVARRGTLSEAAEEIGLTQSAASHALARMRTELKDPIFVRSSRGMRPTPYGAQLASSVRDAVRCLHAGLNRYPDFSPATANETFNVVMSDVGQFLSLPKLLTHLAKKAPGVTLRVHEMPIKAPHLAFETGEVNLAVGAFTKLIVGCRQQRLYRERYVCVARRDHPLFKRGMTADAFCRVPHAIVDPRGHVHEELDRWLVQQNVPRTPKLHVPYFASLLPALANSDLLVVMANRLAQMFADLIPLKIMPPPTSLPIYNVSLFWHERFHRDPANRWLRQLYIDLFGDSKRRVLPKTNDSLRVEMAETALHR